MPYLSKNNPRAFAGAFSPWAANLSAWGFSELIEARSAKPFVTGHETGRTCLIVPQIEPQRVSLLVMYSVRRAMTPDRMTDSIPELIEQWDKLARGFVWSEINAAVLPHHRGLDHNATVRAVNEITSTPFTHVPSLGEIDAALSTSLEVFEEKPFERIRHAISQLA
jgi:hypothetical protein